MNCHCFGITHWATTISDTSRNAAGRRTGWGFALQLCALRYPARALAPGEVIPHEVLSFIGAQLGAPADALLTYAARRQTRQEHMEALRAI